MSLHSRILWTGIHVGVRMQIATHGLRSQCGPGSTYGLAGLRRAVRLDSGRADANPIARSLHQQARARPALSARVLRTPSGGRSGGSGAAASRRSTSEAISGFFNPLKPNGAAVAWASVPSRSSRARGMPAESPGSRHGEVHVHQVALAVELQASRLQSRSRELGHDPRERPLGCILRHLELRLVVDEGRQRGLSDRVQLVVERGRGGLHYRPREAANTTRATIAASTASGGAPENTAAPLRSRPWHACAAARAAIAECARP